MTSSYNESRLIGMAQLRITHYFFYVGFFFNSMVPLSAQDKCLVRSITVQVPDVIAITGGDFIAFRWEVRGVYGDMMRNAVRDELRRLIREIRESYRVDISLKQPIFGFPKWKLSVKGSLGHRQLTLLYPQKLAPCN